MKIKIFAILLFLTFSFKSIAQNNDSTLYSFLEFDNGIAVKDIVVDFKCVGKDPIATINAKDSLISAINKSIMLNSNTAMEFYYNNDYFMLIPNNPNQCLIKWTLASEEIHNLYDEKWKSACEDVYEYNKGDIYE